MKIGLESYFDAAHRLPLYDGKCARVHGHTYCIEIVLDGPVGEDGFVMDFYEVKRILGEATRDLDHSELNRLIPNPTAENIVTYIHRRVAQALVGRGVSLVSVKLWEGQDKWVMLDE